MSISKFQERFLTKKGCGTVITILMAAMFLGFGFGNSQCAHFFNPGQNPGEDTGQGPIIAQVGKVPVPQQALDTIVNNMSQQAQGQTGYQFQVAVHLRAVSEAMNEAAMAYIAQRDHVPITDDAAIRAAQSILQTQVQQLQSDPALTKGIKNPTPKQVLDAFVKKYQKTPDQLVQADLDRLKSALSDKDKHAQVLAGLAQPILQNALQVRYTPTDAELRARYDTYALKRILISKAKNSKLDARVAEVQAALSKGMSFDDAVDKFSDDPAPSKGAKKSTHEWDTPGSMVTGPGAQPEYKVLQGQKAGFVSPPQDVPEGKVIFRIDSFRNTAPKDLSRDKDREAQVKAGMELQKEIQTVLSGSETTWNNKGDKALFELSQAMENPMTSANPTAALQKVQDDAKAALKGSPADAQAATYAWYGASETLYNSPGADKAKLRDQRIELLNQVLQSYEDFNVRMELVDLYIQKKDGQDALGNLVTASRNNTVYDATGQNNFGTIAAKSAQLSAAKLVTDAQLKELDTAQDAWRAEKANEDKQADLAKQQAAKSKALDEENARKNAELVQKQKEQAAKAGGSAPAGKSGAGINFGGPSGSTAGK